MLNWLKRRGRFRRWAVCLLLVLVFGAVCGCRTVSYYAQAIKGHCQVLAKEEPVRKLMKDPNLPADLKARFELMDRLRAFAEAELYLPVNGHYLKYADVGRPYVVWNVEAAPEFSLEPKAWWYPFVGRLEYRGYFSRAGATNYAAVLRKKGYDVHVGGVTAYSTLGWFKDPLLNTFIFDPEPDLAETLFHELSHQQVFAHGDTDFNEAFATTLGQEGARRWLQAKGDSAPYKDYLTQLKHHEQFVGLVMRARQRLEQLYGDTCSPDGKIKAARQHPLPPDELRARKEAIFEELRREYADLKRQWEGEAAHENWFAAPANNAKLNAVATYYELVPGFHALLAEQQGDLREFYAAVKRLTKLQKRERHEQLRTLARNARATSAERPANQAALEALPGERRGQ